MTARRARHGLAVCDGRRGAIRRRLACAPPRRAGLPPHPSGSRPPVRRPRPFQALNGGARAAEERIRPASRRRAPRRALNLHVGGIAAPRTASLYRRSLQRAAPLQSPLIRFRHRQRPSGSFEALFAHRLAGIAGREFVGLKATSTATQKGCDKANKGGRSRPYSIVHRQRVKVG